MENHSQAASLPLLSREPAPLLPQQPSPLTLGSQLSALPSSQVESLTEQKGPYCCKSPHMEHLTTLQFHSALPSFLSIKRDQPVDRIPAISLPLKPWFQVGTAPHPPGERAGHSQGPFSLPSSQVSLWTCMLHGEDCPLFPTVLLEQCFRNI